MKDKFAYLMDFYAIFERLKMGGLLVTFIFHIPVFWITTSNASFFMPDALDPQGCGECCQQYRTVAAPPYLAIVIANDDVMSCS